MNRKTFFSGSLILARRHFGSGGCEAAAQIAAGANRVENDRAKRDIDRRQDRVRRALDDVFSP